MSRCGGRLAQLHPCIQHRHDVILIKRPLTRALLTPNSNFQSFITRQWNLSISSRYFLEIPILPKRLSIPGKVTDGRLRRAK